MGLPPHFESTDLEQGYVAMGIPDTEVFSSLIFLQLIEKSKEKHSKVFSLPIMTQAHTDTRIIYLTLTF